MHDIKIKGGTLIDGTGTARVRADVAIKDGKISAIGEDIGQATREIDADGHIVTPGFVDVHTHYDGQASWDEEMAPSTLHGVTTAVMGSCGVGFAPVHSDDHEALIELMEGVEDIPGSALAEGVTWDWESFPQYMDALAKMPRTIDIACQVPHDALRMYVMRDRATAQEIATDDDIAQMRDLVAQALDCGAIGFSTGRTENHRTTRGLPTPASEATEKELRGIASVFKGRTRGVLQAVSDFDMHHGEESFEGELEVLLEMARAGQRPMSISLMQRDQAPNQWKRIFAGLEAAQKEGLDIRAQCAPRAIGVMLGLDATFHPFVGFPSYKRIAHLPLDERVAQMRKPEFRERLLKETHEPITGDGSAVPPLADMLLANIELVMLRLFNLGENPNYEPDPKSSLAMAAFDKEQGALETLYDALLEEDGRALLYFPLMNYTDMNLDNVREMITHPLALPGLSDGGAHVGTICDSSFNTFLMSYWARDRDHDRIPLERVIQMQTQDTASFLGMGDRGTIQVGKRADLNVIDYENLRLHSPKLVTDLPAGGKRLLQVADGYRATMVNGELIRERGEFTGARPGTVVR
jgi:N-acyl-D-aspartate/D-glutamate deacylase